jgi:Tfp pilus assembly major pilin PilA
MKKLLLILAASLVIPAVFGSAYAKDKPTKIPKLTELNVKGLDHFTKKLPKGSGTITSLNFQSNNAAKVSAKATAKAQDFKCALIYSDKWDGSDNYGAYTFSSDNIDKFELKYQNASAYANAGGFFTPDKFYFTYYTREDYDNYVTTYVVNTNTWKLEKTIDQDGDIYSIAYDMSYDPIEKVAFGSFYDGTDETSYWGYMDLSSGTVYKIADLEGILVAVAINDNGEAYAITNGGYLVKVSKYTGELTVVKGITSTTSEYQQSAAFAEDGSLYWALVASTDTGGYGTGLAKIDVSTGAASLIGQFEDSENVVALYCEPTAADEGAPAAPSNLKLNYTDDNLTGTVSFDVPTVDNLGATISGDVTYIIYVDGEESVTGTAAAGSTVNAKVSVPNAGVHTIAVRLRNSKGDSQRISDSQWIGIDRPVAVTNLTLKKDGDKAILSWTAPAGGALGGYFDPARVNYTITRLSDNKVVATELKDTSFTDDLSGLESQAYVTYRVTAFSDDAQGASATSNGIVFGPAFQTPVSFTFDTEADYNLFTIIDNNENLNKDDGLWQYSPSGQCPGYVCGTLDGDDWLITPDVYLKADHQYTFNYDVLCYSNYWPDNYEVYMGPSATIEGMTTKLVPNTQIYWDEYRTNTLTITVPKDGTYNFGFHALSEAGGAFFLVDNIEVTESYALKAPIAVSDLTAVAGDKGAATAKVTFTTPTEAVDGSSLSALTSVKITRNFQTVKEFSNPGIGTALSFDDTDVPTGNATYRVVASTKEGEGIVSEVTVWVGLDTPAEPTVHMAVKNGNPVLTWEAPQGRGQNGGYVNPDDLTYIVYRATDGSILASDLKAFTYTDTEYEPDFDGEQALVQYGVFAQNSAGIGYPGSNFVIEGKNYELPFKESFAGGKTDKLLLISTSVTGQDGYDNWQIDDDYNGMSQDNDGGNIMIMPATPGVQSTIQMGKIDMTKASNANLSFHLMRYTFDNDFPETNPEDDYIEVFVGGADYETTLVKTIRSCDLKAGKYTQFTVPLTEYEGTDFIFLQFKMNAVAAYFPVLLDNIEVKSTYKTNLQVTDFSVPTSVDVTSDFTATVTVKNDGTSSASNFTVAVKLGDEVLASNVDSEALAAGESRSYTFDLNAASTWADAQVLTAEVTIDGDQYSNDNTGETTVNVIRPAVNAVTDLSVNASETSATFSWTAPEIATTQKIVESFESYAHGAKNDGSVGNWTMIDADKTWGVNADVYVPAYWNTRAFTVFDPEDGENGDATTYAAHSGSKSAIAFPNFESDNDDWMVTPKLSGNAQTVSFWARSAGTSGNDELIVYYSTGEPTTAAFKAAPKLSDREITLTNEWTKYEYDIPEGALYFAFRYDVEDGDAAMIDDVEFEQAAVYNVTPEIEGYNLYKDNVKVNDTVITATSYTVNSNINGNYYVTVVYNTGESAASNVVSISAGVDDITIDAANDDAPTYDLYGRRVFNLQDGQLYVRKGQKFIYRKF